MKDPDLLLDLRAHNSSHSDQFSVFWENLQAFLKDQSTVHELRHGDVAYMAKAISVRDLVQEVTKLCPHETPIPSLQWVRLQFCPRNPRAKVASLYRGHFKVKMMVQKSQFCHDHVDQHYYVALFIYTQEHAVKFREHSVFFCGDDQHHIKVEEPGSPLAAAEHWRQVVVSLKQSFQVGDHDFSRFSLIPSVNLEVNIAESIDRLWYQGKVFIGFKEAAYEAPSPI